MVKNCVLELLVKNCLLEHLPYYTTLCGLKSTLLRGGGGGQVIL